jgi:outer membrane lipoprotein SlyB
MMADVRQRLDRVPFVPFIIRTPDGHDYPVQTVDHAKILPRGHRVAVFADDGTIAVLGPLHINGVVDEPNGTE